MRFGTLHHLVLLTRLDNICEANEESNKQMGTKKNNNRIQYHLHILHMHRRRLFDQEAAANQPTQVNPVAAKAIVALPRIRGRASLSLFR
jgi:hypothetical protein